MNVTLKFSNDFETHIKREAKQANLDIPAFLMSALRNYLGYHQPQTQEHPDRLSKIESDLLQKINLGFSEDEWERYHALIEKRDDEVITSEELEELIALSNELEKANAHRLSHLIELADYRQISVKALMEELGITPVPVYA